MSILGKVSDGFRAESNKGGGFGIAEGESLGKKRSCTGKRSVLEECRMDMTSPLGCKSRDKSRRKGTRVNGTSARWSFAGSTRQHQQKWLFLISSLEKAHTSLEEYWAMLHAYRCKIKKMRDVNLDALMHCLVATTITRRERMALGHLLLLHRTF